MNIKDYYKKLPFDEKSVFIETLSIKTALAPATIRNALYGEGKLGRKHYKTICSVTKNKVKLKDLRK